MIIDMHYHTELTSNGQLRTEDLLAYVKRTHLIERAREKGLDAICLTEHDRIWPADAVQAVRDEFGFPVFRGMEVSSNFAAYGHVLVYGMETYMGGMWYVEKLQRYVQEANGVMFVAHPFRELLTWSHNPDHKTITVEEGCTWPVFQMVHGLEVYNGGTTDKENEMAREVCRRLNLLAMGGSDAHSVVGVGNCVSIFENEVSSQEQLLEELRAGRFRAGVYRRGQFVPVD
ncbi:MAG: hypothetical protein EPO21_08660 [Chloroflexota bacterium]|nr:MAG: hypothetical protein EPO21_08660 [Chloroflexota bacterium]